MTTTSPITCLRPVILPVSPSDRMLKGRDRVRALSRQARQALSDSCAISGLRLDHFPKNETGVPQPVDGVYWSISHKSDVVGGVAATVPVGFDLETIGPVSDAVMKRAAGPMEWQMAGGVSRRTFFRFWTAKEAVLKAVGIGFAGMSRCRVVEIADDTRMVLAYDTIRWPVCHHWFDEHVAAVTARGFRVAWTVRC